MAKKQAGARANNAPDVTGRRVALCFIFSTALIVLGFFLVFDIAIRVDRFRQRLFGSPTSIQSIVDSSSPNTEKSSPLSYSQCLPLVGQVAANAPVVALLFLSSPSTVFRTIVAVIINPVQTVIGTGLWSYIFHERHKGFSPTVANRYAATAILVVSIRPGIIAAIQHGEIYLPQRMICKAMLGNGFQSPFFPQAAATLYPAPTQVGSSHLVMISAIAKAIPDSASFVCVGKGYNQQPTEAQSGQVFDARGMGCRIKGHGDLLSRCVKPQDVSASLRQLVNCTPILPRNVISVQGATCAC